MKKEIEAVSEGWLVFGKALIFCVFAAFFIVCTLIFFSGIFLWSLLV